MKVIGVIQARYHSKRLPGKVMAKIGGKPIIQHIWDRLLTCKNIDELVVSYGCKCGHSACGGCVDFLGYCRANGIYVDMPETEECDLLGRHREVVVKRHGNAMVRVTADQPFIDPMHVEEMVEWFFDYINIDGAVNWNPRSYPDGQDVEVITLRTMERLHNDSTCPREDWITYLVNNPGYSIENRFKYYSSYKHINMCVDTQDMLDVANEAYESYRGHDWTVMAEVYRGISLRKIAEANKK